MTGDGKGWDGVDNGWWDGMGWDGMVDKMGVVWHGMVR